MDGVVPKPTPSDFHFRGTVRRYYIAAEEVTWDYAPTGWDNWMGVPFDISPRAQKAGFVEPGTKWQKAIYVGYTDDTFKTPLEKPAWQGIQGPTLRSEVGDMVEILFVNRLRSNYVSLHSMGLAYSKDDEGSSYANNTVPGQESGFSVGNSVPPGGCYVYKWLVNHASVPPAGQPSDAYSYHSYVSFQEDMNSGLFGPQIIYQPGMMEATMASYREFPILFMGYDESNSFMSAINAKARNASSHESDYPDTLSGRNLGNSSIWKPQLANLLSSDRMESKDAPEFMAINGYIFANNPPFQMCLNDPVIWYFYGMGKDSHAFHMHGNNFQHPLGMNSATICKQPTLPLFLHSSAVMQPKLTAPIKAANSGEMYALFMNASIYGFWEVICHVADHQAKGMVANYFVQNPPCPLRPLAPPMPLGIMS